MFYKKKDEGSFERDKNLDFIDFGKIYFDVKEFKPREIFFFNLIINSVDFPNLSSQFNSNILTCPGSGAGCFWPD